MEMRGGEGDKYGMNCGSADGYKYDRGEEGEVSCEEGGISVNKKVEGGGTLVDGKKGGMIGEEGT